MDERQKRGLPECAVDAIPDDCVLLHEAYLWLSWQFDEIADGDIYLANLAGNEFVQSSLNSCRAQNPETHDTEDSLSRVDAAAHMLLRDALTAGRLRAFIRDPEAGIALKLGRDGWLPKWFENVEERIPPGPRLDSYVHPDDPFNQGPLTATLRGRLRPVFFKTEEFRSWANAIVERVALQAGQKPPDDLEIAGRKLLAAINAIKKIWGAKGPPKDLTAKMRNEKIKKYLKKEGYENPSEQTVRRAIAELRRRDRS